MNTNLLRNIPKLPRTIMNMAATINDQTGWFSTTICGGPVPDLGGEIHTFMSVLLRLFGCSCILTSRCSFHHGTTKENNDFEAFLGKDVFESTIGEKYDDFLYEAFSKCDYKEPVEV